MGNGLRVGITGAVGDLGRLVLPRLLADDGVKEVLALDVAAPPSHPKLRYHQVDLTRHEAERELADAVGEEGVDALYHLAFVWSRPNPGAGGGGIHELEVMGSMRVLELAERGGVRRLILPSLTAVYGPSPSNPALIREHTPPQPSRSRMVSDKVEVEALVQKFQARHPALPVLILRLAPLLGPRLNNPATRLLRQPVVPTLLGFDPLWQALHEDDAGDAFHRALRAPAKGPFNIASEGVLPLSALIRLAGGRPLPLPGPIARNTLRALNSYGGVGVPSALLDFMHYAWVADPERARRALGFVPRHHARDAVASLRRG